jgi:hypothetical protein
MRTPKISLLIKNGQLKNFGAAVSRRIIAIEKEGIWQTLYVINHVIVMSGP